MVSIVPVAEQRVAWDTKSVTTSLKRADSLRIQVSEVDLTLPNDLSRSVVLSSTQEPALTDARPATAPPQINESTKDVSTQTTDDDLDTAEHVYSEVFFPVLERVFDGPVNNIEAVAGRCIRCDKMIDRFSTFAAQAVVSSCGHTQRRTCTDCVVELLSKAGDEVLRCGEAYCESAAVIQIFQIELQLQRVESELRTSISVDDEPNDVYLTPVFRRDWAVYSEKLRQYEAKTFYCCICGDQKSRETGRLQPGESTTCDHESNCCLDCLRQAIDAQFEERMWDAITCPECVMPIDYAVVKKMVSAEQFEKYDRYLMSATLQSSSSFRWCPHPGCESGQFVEVHCKDADRSVTCNACEKTFCLTHREPHEGKTCRQYDRTSRLSQILKSSDRAIWRTTKKCPGTGCSAKIEKNEGCSHMTCTMCRFEFCWICKIPYENVYMNGNRAHRWFCRHKLTRW